MMRLHAGAAVLGIVVAISAAGVAAQPRAPKATPPHPTSTKANSPRALNPPAPQRPATKVAVLLGADASSTSATLAGLDAARKRGRLAVSVRLPSASDELDAALDTLAAGGFDLIIGVGPYYRDAFRVASAERPDVRFLLLDAELPYAPNVRAATFRTDEGSFLAGVAAAAESRHGAVGFVGAMETPALLALECGYETGIRWAARELKRTVRGSVAYIGSTPEAFADPAHGADVSRAMIADKRVDVFYAAAGRSSAGVIEAAREARVKAIGADTEPTHLTRDVLLTAVRKRHDRAIASAIADVRASAFRGGAVEMNLANGGVELALPGRMAATTRKLVEKARAAIAAGREPTCVKPEERPEAWPFPPRPGEPEGEQQARD